MTPNKTPEEKLNEEQKVDTKAAEAEEKRREKNLISSEKGVEGVEIVDEMEQAYLDYAMSVIVQRALPAVEDGLKPVHRRILYAMHSIGLDSSKPTKKSAAVVGEVLGKYHPHGDASVYEAMVRMAQEFSLRYPLVHGQGNFGSMDGDSAAAMRYTEAKLSKISNEMLGDIEKETVKMIPNFDNSTKEPDSLPAKLPNLLINGATGIAVGMATNIPPHNLTEVCDALTECINKPDVTVEQLAEIVRGPDFPTGALVMGSGIKDMYKAGKGKLIVRSRISMEDHKGKPTIVLTELPYQVNKAELVKEIARLTSEKKFPDIWDIRDESAKGKVRVVIELRKGVDPKYTINKLYKLTNVQTSFDANMLALVDKKPRVLSLKDILTEFIKYRQIIVRKRSKFELTKAEERLEIVLGMLIALKEIDRIVDLIKKSENATAAHEGLMKKFGLTTRQSKAVLETKLQQLTHMEATKFKDEEKSLKELIAELKTILGDEKEILKIIKREVSEIKNKYGDERRTKVVKQVDEISESDIIERKEVVVMMTGGGYIKRVDLKDYKEQKRGGSGVSGGEMKEEDVVKKMLVCSTHDYILFFSSRGRVYWLKANDIPQSERQGKGKAIVNLLNMRDETVANAMAIKNFEQGYLMLATKLGMVKKLPLKLVSRPRSTGVRVMNLPADGSDVLINVQIVEDKQEVLMITQKGKAIRFSSDEVRPMGRASYGVKGAELGKTDEIVSLESIPQKDGKITILTATEKGFGKRSELEEYRKTARGAKGVISLDVSERTGNVINALSVRDKDSIIVTTTKGMVIREKVKEIRVMGRATQGVHIVKLKEGDKVADIVKVLSDDELDVFARLDGSSSASSAGAGNGNKGQTTLK